MNATNSKTQAGLRKPRPSASSVNSGGLSKRQLAAIHAHANHMGWDDDQYREWLKGQFGVDSAKGLSQSQFARFLELTGHQPPPAGQPVKTQTSKTMITPQQQRKVVALWNAKAHIKTLDALSVWLKARWGVTHSRNLDKQQATDVITALEGGGWEIERGEWDRFRAGQRRVPDALRHQARKEQRK